MIELWKHIILMALAVFGIAIFCYLWSVVLDKIFGED
jgi:hypothetical protein